MNSRKRKNSPISIPQDLLANKRAKLLSSLWASPAEDNSGSVTKHPSCPGPSCSERTAAGEKPERYPADWQNRQAAGEKSDFSPRPERKVEPTIATSRRGERLSVSPRRLNSSIPRLEEKSASVPVPGKASIQTRRSVQEETQHITAGPSRSTKDIGGQSGALNGRGSFHQAPTLPEFVVLISQHSSFAREEYIRYQSSSSSTRTTSSLLQLQDSGIGESSPSSESAVPDESERGGVIPDSQSLPNSSSYVPTSSTSKSVRSSTQAGTRNSVVVASSWIISTNSPALRPVSSYSPTPEPSDPIEDSLDPSPKGRQSIGTRSSRSRSLPFGASIEASGLNQTEPRQTSRNARKRISTLDRKSGHKASGVSTEFAVRSRVSEVPSSSDLYTRVQSSLGIPRTAHADLQSEIEENLGYQSVERRIPGISNLEHRAGAQIESNQTHISQESLTSSIPSAEDVWQIIPKPVHSASQLSSSSRDPSSVKSTIVQNLEDSTQLDFSIDPPVVPEEQLADSQITQETESSILSERDPNPQPRLNTHTPVETKDFVLPSIELVDTENENVPGSFPFTTGTQHSYILGSRRPVQLPSVSDAEMAEISQTQTGLTSNIAPAPAMPAARPRRSVQERLKNMRAVSAAAFEANVAARLANIEQTQSPRPEIERTPSAIPEKAGPPEAPESRLEVQPMEVPVEVPLPMRVSQVDPHTPSQPSKLSFRREMTYSQTITTLNPVHLGEMEFIVPLSMNTRVRDQYISTINYYRQAIEDLMRDEIPEPAVIEQVQEMLRRVHQVTTHVDLDSGDSITQQQASPEDEAVWAENCSAKFQFLRYLFDCIRDLDMHVGIIARPGRLLGIVETFLKGRHIVYNRPDTLMRSDPRAAEGRMEVSLIASGEEGAAALPKAANLVIALDGSLDARDVQVGILRSHITNVGQLAPIIHLLVYNSAEHIERCLSTSIEPLDRLRKIVSCMTQTRHEVGLLVQEEAGSLAAAEEVAAFLEAGGVEEEWTFPAIRPIDGIEFLESVQDTESIHSDTSPHHDQTGPPAPTLKRALDNTDATPGMPKRQRTTPTPAADVTHISDSATQDSLLARSQTQTITELRNELQIARNQLASIRSSSTEREKHLQTTINNTENRLQEHIDALSSLQARYESLNRSSHLLRDSKASFSFTVTSLEEKLEKRAVDVANLISDRQRLESELKDARQALLASSVPEIAELERLREEARVLTKQKDALQKKTESLTKDFEFTRQQYQQASSSAVELASTNTDLEAQVASLTLRASATALNLAAINNATEVSRHRSRVVELETLLADREDLLRRKDDELREIKRGRGGVQTRGSSVQPRSPRAGAGGSRGGSPVPVVGVGGLLGMGGMGGMGGMEMRRGGSGLRYS